MKKLNFALTIVMVMFFGISSVIYASNQTIKINQSKKPNLTITESSALKLALKASINEIDISSIKTDGGEFIRLNIGGFGKSRIEGSPELPVLYRLIEMPANSNPKVEIKKFKEKEFKLNERGVLKQLVPMQLSQPKCGSSRAFEFNSSIYSTNEFIGQELVAVENVGILRGANIGRLNISPVSYNPITNVIKVVTDIEFEITFEGGSIEKTREIKASTRSPFFSGIYNQLLNSQNYHTRDYITTYPVSYVIISDRMFENQLAPFIQWKRRKGFTVTAAYTDEIGGTTQQIKDYIQDLYNNGTAENPAPSFVLFVGDIAQIPAWNNGDGVTDRNYVEYTGDLFPEIFYGRFSAENADHLQPYIDKTLMYEQFTMPNPTYLDTVVLVSGVDGSYAQDWGNGQINYGTINYFNEDHDIFSHTYLYPASGSSSAAIIQNVRDGVTFGNYTAHCSPNGWADPPFVISDIPTLTNQDKYGLLIGNCCSSSEFQTVCFAEEITRAPNKGCVGYIGGSNSTYWDEDYYFGVGVGTINENPPPYEETTLGNYDRAFHDHGEDFSDWFTTMDQIVFAGNLAVSESGSSREQYYWDIYNLMGDPSLMIYFSMPEVNPVTHDPFIMIGATSTTINAAPYSYVALNNNGQNIVSALADQNGEVVLEFDSFTTPGNAELVITAQNHQPYIADIMIFAPDGPFCIYENHTINDDSLGNGNGMAEYDELVFIDLSMVNYGNDDAVDVEVTISSAYSEVTIEDGTTNYDTIHVNEVVTSENGLLIHLADNVEDQTNLIFDVVAVDNQDSIWESQFEILANAPKLTPENLIIDDSYTGNNNGRLDAGETAILKFKTTNKGHCVAYNITASLLPYNPYITVISGDTTIPMLSTFGAVYPQFEVVVDEDAPEGILAEVRYQLTSGGYFVEKQYYPKLGLILEDWETGDFSKYNWQSDGNMPWTINSQYPYEGFYDVVSGAIGNNQSSEFYIQYQVMSPDSIIFHKKVSSEPDFDFLQFYIDNQLQAEWSGTTQSWTRESFPVSPGMRTFKWVYEKDYSTTGGADKAWIDYIELPVMMVTTVYAGPDNNVCENNQFQCMGSATNYDTIFWATSGTGDFINPQSLDAIYNPSDDDIASGDVALSLNLIDVDGISASDTMNLSFTFLPEQPSMPVGPEQIDLQTTLESEYEVEQTNNVSYYQWELYPQEAGSITGNQNIVTVGWNTQYEGEAWLKAAAINNCGSGSFSDSLLIVVSNPVGIEANSKEFGLDISPNPTTGLFILQINSEKSMPVDIVITNQKGQQVYSNKFISDKELSKVAINLSDQANGVYFVKLRYSNEIISKKVILVK